MVAGTVWPIGQVLYPSQLDLFTPLRPAGLAMLEAVSGALALGSDTQRLTLSQANTCVRCRFVYSISQGVCFDTHCLEHSRGRDVLFEYQGQKSGGVSGERYLLYLLCLLAECFTGSPYIWNI